MARVALIADRDDVQFGQGVSVRGIAELVQLLAFLTGSDSQHDLSQVQSVARKHPSGARLTLVAQHASVAEVGFDDATLFPTVVTSRIAVAKLGGYGATRII
jgi:hypothetical protein